MQPEMAAAIELQEGFEFLPQSHEEGIGILQPGFHGQMMNMQQ